MFAFSRIEACQLKSWLISFLSRPPTFGIPCKPIKARFPMRILTFLRSTNNYHQQSRKSERKPQFNVSYSITKTTHCYSSILDTPSPLSQATTGCSSFILTFPHEAVQKGEAEVAGNFWSRSKVPWQSATNGLLQRLPQTYEITKQTTWSTEHTHACPIASAIHRGMFDWLWVIRFQDQKIVRLTLSSFNFRVKTFQTLMVGRPSEVLPPDSKLLTYFLLLKNEFCTWNFCIPGTASRELTSQ